MCLSPCFVPLAHFGRHKSALLSLYFDIFQRRVESTAGRRLRYTRQQLAAQQQPQPRSAPLRMLLRPPPRQELLRRCHCFIPVRHRAATAALLSPRIDTRPFACIFIYRLQTSCTYSDGSILCTSSTDVQTPLGT